MQIYYFVGKVFFFQTITLNNPSQQHSLPSYLVPNTHKLTKGFHCLTCQGWKIYCTV